jgi:hypothetical protein
MEAKTDAVARILGSKWGPSFWVKERRWNSTGEQHWFNCEIVLPEDLRTDDLASAFHKGFVLGRHGSGGRPLNRELVLTYGLDPEAYTGKPTLGPNSEALIRGVAVGRLWQDPEPREGIRGTRWLHYLAEGMDAPDTSEPAEWENT